MNDPEIITLNNPGIKDFSKERNYLLEKAKSDWIFFVDTDETVTENLKKEIRELNPDNFNGFYVKRKIIFLGHEIGEDKVLRLGRKNAGKWVREVHEVWDTEGRIGVLKNYIIHNTAEDLGSYVAKMNKYSDMHARANLIEGKKSSLFKIIFYPKMKFLQNIITGRGFVFSVLQSFHSFLSWSKQWELQKK